MAKPDAKSCSLHFHMRQMKGSRINSEKHVQRGQTDLDFSLSSVLVKVLWISLIPISVQQTTAIYLPATASGSSTHSLCTQPCDTFLPWTALPNPVCSSKFPDQKVLSSFPIPSPLTSSGPFNIANNEIQTRPMLIDRFLWAYSMDSWRTQRTKKLGPPELRRLLRIRTFHCLCFLTDH